jgi:hypothetical protein
MIVGYSLPFPFFWLMGEEKEGGCLEGLGGGKGDSRG